MFNRNLKKDTKQSWRKKCSDISLPVICQSGERWTSAKAAVETTAAAGTPDPDLRSSPWAEMFFLSTRSRYLVSTCITN